ncbi:uncharacterized protein LOC126743948 [Anthonomus grandis grandis]|uniref:uncharacterized protein LOC126743948 n=1 Tax=Anthonomus grandis grandis TaxID=2921223 RepID=UPI0021654D5C|nr:uncharacterized protein LOC126743948 [Anthonomus grandis grandis]
MGYGRGIDIGIVLKVIELLVLIVAIVLFYIEEDYYMDVLSSYRKMGMAVHDSLCICCSAYVILLGTIILLHFIKGIDQDEKFMGYLCATGAILLVASGVCVCIKSDQHSDLLISGIVGIVGAVFLLVDCLKDFKVF